MFNDNRNEEDDSSSPNNVTMNNRKNGLSYQTICLIGSSVLVIILFIGSEIIMKNSFQTNVFNYKLTYDSPLKSKGFFPNYFEHYNELIGNRGQENLTRFYKINVDLKKARLMIPYANPKTYIGPIIEGWPPNKSKEMSFYIKPSQNTVINDISCIRFQESVKLLIIVQSAPEMFERRMSNRKSWMQTAKLEIPEMKALFIFGHTPSQNESLLREEQLKYCDLIQMDYIDHYSNVTFDTVMAMKYTVSVIPRMKNPEFLMIVDDDSYVNVRFLKQKILQDSPVITKNSPMVYGYKIEGKAHVPERGKFRPNQVLPKIGWCYSPEYMFNGKEFKYPPFVSGCGYIIPIQFVYCLYQATLEMPFFHLNDVLVTGFAREFCKLEIFNEKDLFHPFKNLRAAWKKDFILYHYMKADAKLELEQFLKSKF